MTGAAAHHTLPDTHGVGAPPRYLLRSLAAPLRTVVRRRWDLDVSGRGRFPRRGPVVVVANHLGWLDGPLMAVLAPRPLHALTKQEQFTGRTGAFLRQAGQIPLDRHRVDPLAIRTALRVLRDDGVVGVFPEGNRAEGELRRNHPGAAYLALASGAWIQPMIFLGTRERGGTLESVPPAGSRMSIDYGAPFRVALQQWPRRRDEVAEVSEQIRDELKTLLVSAKARTGLETPGPVGQGNEEQK